jgi:hypothetical protein
VEERNRLKEAGYRVKDLPKAPKKPRKADVVLAANEGEGGGHNETHESDIEADKAAGADNEGNDGEDDENAEGEEPTEDDGNIEDDQDGTNDEDDEGENSD